jgi:hypothetical protein
MAAVMEDVWPNIEELLRHDPSVERLRLHGVELIAAELWSREGREVPSELREEARLVEFEAMAVPFVLRRVRAACEGRVVLMKGPELAAHYPSPVMRPYRDLDMLVEDPEAAQAALLDAGFIEVGNPDDYVNVHHLRPLMWPSIQIPIELHREVNHAEWLAPPPTEELFELTEPSATGVAGMLAPIPAAHAVLVVAHSWAHEPLRRLLDLVDVAVVLDGADRAQANELARRWGLERVWRITLDAVDSLLCGQRGGLSSRVWARHLAGIRERSVFETHLALWAATACGLPGARARAIRAATVGFTNAAHPKEEERWGDALRRTSLAFTNALAPQSKHKQIREMRRRT